MAPSTAAPERYFRTEGGEGVGRSGPVGAAAGAPDADGTGAVESRASGRAVAARAADTALSSPALSTATGTTGRPAVVGFDFVRVTASFPEASTGTLAAFAGDSWAATLPNERAHASAQKSSAFFMADLI